MLVGAILPPVSVLACPAWCSPLDQALIQAAFDEVYPRAYREHWFGKADVQIVVTVAEVIVARLTASRRAPSDLDRQQAIDDLIEQVIVQMAPARRSLPAGAFAGFAVRVWEAIRACSWWPSQEAPSSPPLKPSSTLDASVDEGPPLSFPVAAQRLGVSVDAIEDMEKRAEIRTMRIGKRRKVPVAEVKRLLASAAFRFRHDR